MWQNAHASLRLTESSWSKNRILPKAGRRSGLPGRSDGIPAMAASSIASISAWIAAISCSIVLGSVAGALSASVQNTSSAAAAARKQRARTRPGNAMNVILRLIRKEEEARSGCRTPPWAMMPSFLLNSEEIWWRQLSHLCAITRQWCLAQFAGHGSNDLAAKEACLRDCRRPERFRLQRTPLTDAPRCAIARRCASPYCGGRGCGWSAPGAAQGLSGRRVSHTATSLR